MSLIARRLSGHPASGGGGGFDPLADISWHSAFWAEDPAWTPPADGGNVSSWRNAGSGDFGNLTNGGAASTQPTYDASNAAFNGQPVIYSATPGEFLTSGSGTALTQPTTWAAVFSLDNLDSNVRVLFDSQSSSNRQLFYRTSGRWHVYAGTVLDTGDAHDTAAHLLVITFNGASSTVELDGTQIASGSAGSHSVAAITLGRNFSGAQGWSGAYPYIALLDGTLTSQEKSDLLSWSQSHYGTP